MCSDCAFEPFCGADPVYHHATGGDSSAASPFGFCHRNMAIFRLLLDRYESDPFARESSSAGRPMIALWGRADQRSALTAPLQRSVWLLTDRESATASATAAPSSSTTSRRTSRRRVRPLHHATRARDPGQRSQASSSSPTLRLPERRRRPPAQPETGSGSTSSGATTASRTASC